MDREAWRAAFHAVTKSWTWLSDWIELNWFNKIMPFFFPSFLCHYRAFTLETVIDSCSGFSVFAILDELHVITFLFIRTCMDRTWNQRLVRVLAIQVYAPISNAKEAEVEWFYKGLQNLLEVTSKKDVLFIIGGWNAKEGSQETPGVTGKFGLGIRNEAGQRLI